MDNAVLYTTPIFSSYHNMLLILWITITDPQRMIFHSSILSHIVRCIYCGFYNVYHSSTLEHLTRMIELHVILPSLELGLRLHYDQDIFQCSILKSLILYLCNATKATMMFIQFHLISNPKL
jgi:hypothetical protein